MGATAEIFISSVDSRSHPGPFVVVDIKKGLEVCHSRFSSFSKDH